MNKNVRKLAVILILYLGLAQESLSFNFLINLFYSILPTPVKMAFKGEGLQIDQFEYGFANCNFTSFGYLLSSIEFKSGNIIDEKFQFSVPTFYIYGSYVAHVSTGILHIIYPGWQLESEIGWGGISYDTILKNKYRQFFFSGSSGFNWKLYQTHVNKLGITINLTTGYKLHYVLKDMLYYGIQCGILLNNKISGSLELTTTYKGGNFFVFVMDEFKSTSNEKTIMLNLNITLSKKYLLKISALYKNWFIKEHKLLPTERKVQLYGCVIALLSR
ncbi:MAG: hypothetical protein N2643_01565 [Endomicrobia bacterium]|nr:hypothetical protein [Endomicrobiia bacterium]